MWTHPPSSESESRASAMTHPMKKVEHIFKCQEVASMGEVHLETHESQRSRRETLAESRAASSKIKIRRTKYLLKKAVRAAQSKPSCHSLEMSTSLIKTASKSLPKRSLSVTVRNEKRQQFSQKTKKISYSTKSTLCRNWGLGSCRSRAA